MNGPLEEELNNNLDDGVSLKELLKPLELQDLNVPFNFYLAVLLMTSTV